MGMQGSRNTGTRTWQRAALFSAFFVSCVAASFLFRVRLLEAAGRWLNIGQEPSPADYVMVLPGDWNGRPFVAAALIQAGYAQAALVPRVERSPSVLEGIDTPNDEVIRRVLLACGIPADRIIILPGQSTSTYAETRMLRSFLSRHPDCRIIVVTTHFHTRRARMLFRYSLKREELQKINFVSAPTDDFRLEAWWKTEEGFARITEEYVKLVVYWMRYGTGGYWMVTAGGVSVLLAIILWRHRQANADRNRRSPGHRVGLAKSRASRA